MIYSILAQNDPLTQVGVGGIIAILLVKEVLVFVGKQRNNGDGGGIQNQLLSLQRTVQFKDTCAETVKRFDAALTSLEKKVDAGFDSVKTLLLNGHSEEEKEKG
jgi:hypothetical protein